MTRQNDTPRLLNRIMPTGIVLFLLLGVLAPSAKAQQAQPVKAPGPAKPSAPADDISGMYTFLRNGEFLQISIDENQVSGYISRFGDLESDQGQFLDQFFDKASIQGHDVSFTTRLLHGTRFEFKGKYERGPAKTKMEDGYFVIRGTLIEYRTDADGKVTSRSREAEFKLLRQPPDDAEQPKK